MTIFFIIIVGLAFGSFFNVCIHRIPQNESIIFPASHCPFCQKKIKPYDNIPVVSYLLLKGKCRNCSNHIPVSYLIIELVTPLMFLLAYFKMGNQLSLLFFKYIIFISFSLVIFFTDLKQHIIPDKLSIPLIAIGLLFTFFPGSSIETQAIILSLIIVFALLFMLGLLCKLIKKENCMGGGDFKYILGITAFWGISHTFLILFLASLLALFFLIIIRHDFQKKFPFGPFLVIAAFITIFIGKDIFAWYLGIW